MRTALKIAGRIALWALAAAVAFVAVVLIAVAISDDRSDARLGAAVMLFPALGALALCVYGLRHTRPVRDIASPGDVPGTASGLLDDARARLRAGEPIILRPSRRRWGLLLPVFALFTAGSVLALASEPNVVFVVGVLLFGGGLILGTLQMIPGLAYLRIAPDGLVVRTPIKTTRYAWNDIEHFTGYEIHHQYGSTKQVGFDRRDLTPDRQGFWRTVSRGMSGVDNALPDTYGLDHDDLAELLDEARGRYATEHGISESEQADIELMDRAARVPQDRMPLVTALLAVACVVAFVLETRSYGLFPEPVELIDAGGAWSDGGLLALVTANVLHANPIHLLLNLLALAILGTLLEREIGWPRMAVLCVVSGVAGMGLAVVIQPNAVTVGVSGVIFGIAGCAVLRDTHRTRVLGTVAWGMLPIGVIYTFLSPGTSIGAHVGGLIAGLVFGRLWRDADVPEAPPIGAAAAPRPR